jgi:hypothetical protein
MRSRFFVCAALAVSGLVVGVARVGHAADPKAKGANAKKGDSIDNDKVISKQLQWEEKVLGEDEKRGELDKILKAQAINKAATEKAEKEKAQREKEEAARAAREAAAPKNQKKGGEVALPSMPDEGANKNKVKPTEISPKLDTATAAAPPPPTKPADDKFIDKLLKEEGAGKKKKAASASNDDLLDILSTEKKAGTKPKGKGKSEVDNLLLEADKPPAPVAKIKHETPEWQKPEIQSTPVAAPIPQAKPQQKHDDGIIRVVQGAAGSSSSAPASKPTTVATRPTASPMVPAARKAPAAAPSGGWNDPFADGGSRKNVASRSASRSVADEDDFAPAPRRNASAPAAKTATRTAARRPADDSDAWEDPFDAKKAAAARKAAAKPAKAEAPGRWKDPFTDDAQPRSRGSVALRDRDSGREESAGKWNAARRAAPAAADDESPAQAHGRWGVIKKRH